MPAVDDDGAGSTPVALVHLSATRGERKDGDQGAEEEEETPASSSPWMDVLIDSQGTR